MNQKQELLDFLANLLEVDTVDKRKAFLGFVGFTYLGIYLDWEGSNVVFSSRLVEELGRRGQPTMVQFLDNLTGAPQAGGEKRRQTVAALASAVRVLDPASWESQFGVPAAPPPPDQSPDLDMLALTTVSTVLVPFYKDPGVAKSQAAGLVAARLQQALAADPTALVLWAAFKQSPETLEPAMLPIVKAKLAQDPGLADALVPLAAAVIKELTERKPGEVDVIQRIRLVQGKVLGVVIGSEVVNGIIKVSQEMDTVSAGATVIGAQIGSLG